MAGLNRMDSKAPRAHQEIGRLLPLLRPIGNKFEREGTRAASAKMIIRSHVDLEFAAAQLVLEPIDSGVRCIGGYSWYWGKQLESELHNYYTEYFVTLQNLISVLISVSYEKSVEAEGRPIARTIARNLRVIWRPKNTEPDKPDCSAEN
jgi:hypothetical protein